MSNIGYWDRLKKLKIMSLQRRRERYCIIQVWKIINGHSPNGIGMQFKTHPRHGLKATLPPINTRAQMSVRSDHDSSFRIRAAQLWNTLPANVSSLRTLESFKIGLIRFMEQYPDTPPVPGYTPVHDKSLLSWRRTHVMQMS